MACVAVISTAACAGPSRTPKSIFFMTDVNGLRPDYRMLVDAVNNRKPGRLPFYEHIIGPDHMERHLDRNFSGLLYGDAGDRREYFRTVSGFFRDHGYDTVSYEVCVIEILPNAGALTSQTPGPIQDRESFESYPWEALPEMFWQTASPRLEALRETMPDGMKAVGGVGNGIFEIAQDLVGYTQLCLMLEDDPPLFADLLQRIGRLHRTLWKRVLADFGDVFAVCRIGDDLGFKSSTLLAPRTLIERVIPEYRLIVQMVHEAGRAYLQHSCGRIFDVMDAWIDAGINAKHSNEEAVCPFDEWIERYGDRIGVVGGIDTDRLCRMPPDDLYEFVLEEATRFRRKAKGYALGSGNSIPGYVPPDGFLAMSRAGLEIRRREAAGG